MSDRPVVIIGSGLAGYSLARELRKLDAEVPITVLSRDGASAYSKPTLSNALAGGVSADRIATGSVDDQRRTLRAEVLARTTVTRIDTATKRVEHEGGSIEYRSLALALGADPIRLPIGGDASSEVTSVNDLDDYRRFRARLDDARARRERPRVAVIGAGLIGAEFANDLAATGHDVTVLDVAPQVLGRLLPREGASLVETALARIGVTFELGVSVSRVDRDGDALRLTLSDGRALTADVVLSAVGLTPRTALAASSGLAVRRGIVVDRTLRASAPDVYALGDCAEVEGLVLPFVMPLLACARALARTLAGTPTHVVYPAMPVVVKTPAMPVVVAPPKRTTGAWRLTEHEGGLVARYEVDGALEGFALVGATAVKERASLAKLLPPTLAAE